MGRWNYSYLADWALSCEFKMDISTDGKITNAYDEMYTALGVVVTGDSLSYSSSRATYSLHLKHQYIQFLVAKVIYVEKLMVRILF